MIYYVTHEGARSVQVCGKRLETSWSVVGPIELLVSSNSRFQTGCYVNSIPPTSQVCCNTAWRSDWLTVVVIRTHYSGNVNRESGRIVDEKQVPRGLRYNLRCNFLRNRDSGVLSANI